MVSVQNLGVEFSARPLFSGATFVVGEHDRIALVGKNGAGKSTLLKIIAGLATPTTGSVNIQNGLLVGYLPQVMVLTDSSTVRDEAMRAFDNIRQLREEVTELGSQLASREDYESGSYFALVEEFSRKNERLAMLGEDGIEAAVERTLTGLGFERSDLDRPTREFSGGWRMRIELAKILLQSPDLLLLDEPTNHLDIESIQWLESFLQSKGCAVILISHDRAFINNVTNRTLEITCGQIVDYKVKYDDFVRLRAERREQQIRAYENQQKEIADTKAFIERFRYQATKAVQVQQRIRQLEKMQIVEIDEVDNSSLHLKFPPCQRSGDFPLICDGVAKSFPQRNIFHDVNITIRRGEKVAFVGRNGEGKTTLVRCIMHQLDHEGSLKVGHKVQIGYFAQNQAQLLDDSLTVFDTIDRVAVGEIRTRIRELLGSFMFRGDDIDKFVRVLSGGERSMLSMIKLLLQPVNMLLLDEPTNHLDMRSKDVLKEAIKAFDGTAIIVSHDREFLDGLVTKVYEFGGGVVKEHLGGIYDYLQKRGLSSLQQLEHKTATDVLRKQETTSGKLQYQQQKETAKRKKALEKAVAESEKAVMELEAAIGIVEELMSQPNCDEALFVKHATLKQQLQKAEDEWTEAVEALDRNA